MRFLGMMVMVCMLAIVASEAKADYLIRNRAVVVTSGFPVVTAADVCDNCDPVVSTVRVRDFGYGNSVNVFGVNGYRGFGVRDFGIRDYGVRSFAVRDVAFRRNDVNIRVNGIGGGFRNRVVVRVR